MARGTLVLHGSKELADAFRKLSGPGLHRVLRNVSLAGARVQAKAIKRDAPRPGADHEYATGALARSVKVKELKPRKGFARTALAGFATPAGKHAHLVDEGTDEHPITTDGVTWQHPGADAKPFFSRALAQTAPEAQRKMLAVAKSGIERELLKQSAPRKVSIKVQRGGG